MSSHDHQHHQGHKGCGSGGKHGGCPEGRPAERVPTCKEVSEFLMAFLDKELPSAQQDEFARHMAMCPPCAEYMRTYQDTIKLCKGAHAAGKSVEKPSEKPPEQLINAILASRRK